MYNTRSSGGNQYTRKSENFRGQQQQNQTAPHNFVIPTKSPGKVEIMTHASHQQPAEDDVSLNNLQNPAPTSVNQSPENKKTVVEDNNKNNALNDDDVQSAEESSTGKSEIKWPVKRKVNKKEQKKRLNARMRRLVCPKSPLMVFSELYKNIPITINEESQNNFVMYTASFEVDGQVYTGNHVSKTQAKQKACENFLRVVLEKKMSEPEVKPECFTENNMEVGSEENGTSAKPYRGPPMEDFPWPQFVSLAMHNLISHWDLQPVTTKVVQKKPKAAKVAGMKKFPDNPENYHPVQLLHQMTPGITFKEVTITANNPSVFEVSCEISSIQFKGQGTTKKGAKKECAISVIKHFWNFDFHTNQKTV